VITLSSFHFILRPYSHKTFWRTILQYCDKKTFFNQYIFSTCELKIFFSAYLKQFWNVSTIFWRKIIYFLSKYLFIFLLQYRNIVCQNVSCEYGLNVLFTFCRTSFVNTTVIQLWKWVYSTKATIPVTPFESFSSPQKIKTLSLNQGKKIQLLKQKPPVLNWYSRERKFFIIISSLVPLIEKVLWI